MTLKSLSLKIAAAAAAALIILANTQVGFCSAVSAFADVKGHWSESYVAALTDQGLIAGMPDGLFHPDEQITLEQFVKIIIARKYGEQKPISGGNWASGYVKIAIDAGIITESDLDGYALTRGDTAMLVDLSLQNLFDEDVLEDNSVSEQLVDLPACNSCKVHIAEIYAKGIMVGRPGLIFDNGATLTRAEACVIISRMFDVSQRTPPQKNIPPESNLLTADSLKILMNSGSIVVLTDIRSREEYTAGHIPGSVSIPLDELTSQNAKQLQDKDALIVVYSRSDESSSQAYEFLVGLGYKKVYDFGAVTRWQYDLEKERR